MSILVVEDSSDVQDLVYEMLGARYDLCRAYTIQEARKFLDSKHFDLLILDVHLPDGNGFEFCSELMKKERYSTIPVIFLTAKDSVEDIVAGYKLGADDYIVKPFDPRIFRAKIEAKLQRFQNLAEASKLIVRGPIEVNVSEQRAYLLDEQSGKKTSLDLTPTEFRLLTTLIAHEEQILNRDQLVEKVWTEDTHLSDRVVDIHISSLRKKLLQHGHLIRTIYGSGYSFTNTPAKG